MKKTLLAVLLSLLSLTAFAEDRVYFQDSDGSRNFLVLKSEKCSDELKGVAMANGVPPSYADQMLSGEIQIISENRFTPICYLQASEDADVIFMVSEKFGGVIDVSALGKFETPTFSKKKATGE